MKQPTQGPAPLSKSDYYSCCCYQRTTRRLTCDQRRRMNSSPAMPGGILLLVSLLMTAPPRSPLWVSGTTSLNNTSPSLCFPACGPLGFCVPDCGHDKDEDPQNCDTYKCECKPGFTGRDCSLHSPDVCQVHTNLAQAELHVEQCRNGGECVERDSEGGHVWAVCDCAKAFGASGMSVENLDCEYSVTDVCEDGATHSDYAYCYNGGKCLGNIGARSKEPHPGCNCSGTGFAGRHCQFPQESIPIEEDVFVATGKDIIVDYDKESKAMTRPAKATSPTTTVMVTLTFLGLAVFLYGFVQRRIRRPAMVAGQVELEMSCSSDDDFVEGTSGFHSTAAGENHQLRRQDGMIVSLTTVC